MRRARTPGPDPPLARPGPGPPRPRPGPHSPCRGSCALASVRARGEPRAGRAPGVPPSPPLYPAGAASPIALPLLCAGPDSMHASYSGGGAPAATGARVRARGRGRAARSRGAPMAPDGGSEAGGWREAAGEGEEEHPPPPGARLVPLPGPSGGPAPVSHGASLPSSPGATLGSPRPGMRCLRALSGSAPGRTVD